MSNLKDALRLLEEKQFQKARDIMEELLEQNPKKRNGREMGSNLYP